MVLCVNVLILPIQFGWDGCWYSSGVIVHIFGAHLQRQTLGFEGIIVAVLGLSSCSSQVVEHRLSSCGAQA